jgi:hypothetical protein
MAEGNVRNAVLLKMSRRKREGAPVRDPLTRSTLRGDLEAVQQLLGRSDLLPACVLGL